jgi:2-aminomuconate deaminase
MTLESKFLKGRAIPLGKYPHIKRVGDFLFVSGTSSRRADNSFEGAKKLKDGSFELDIKEQTKAVILNIQTILQSMDADLENIVDMSSFLVDMRDFDGYNEIYGQFFTHDGPTRTTVAVYQLPHPHILIEMKAIAYKPIK